MAQDLNSLLQSLQELTRAAKEGRLSRAELEVEVRKVTLALQEVLTRLGGQLQATASPGTASLVEVFRSQLATVLQQNGVEMEQTDEMKKLSEELERLKRGFIRS
ncbi:hypothetical protein [Pyxidicoccus sp. MSG2]|uniref:hypothetical protein n=1 Tax=Pyxidicoccus sp. MSG2 TaxID=2996790 RepID=UPI00226DF638|nr:hypothetical protein [Pyxidicoccus sp. MSG2]MCY1019684.1 hypothetical protein [Pyxidicoccus sp. MSG2]